MIGQTPPPAHARTIGRRKSRVSGRRSTRLLLFGALGVPFLGSIPATRGALQSPSTTAARTQNLTDTAHLHYVKSYNSALLEEGSATGDLPGTVKLQLNVGPTVTGTFTISTRNGAITGYGTGELNGSGLYASFGGTMHIILGTGRYAHTHGHGGFYGTLNRHTYAVVVQTTGTLSLRTAT